MDFAFSEEQDEFRDVVARFVGERWPSSEVRRLFESDQSHDPGVWKQMGAELGRLPDISISDDPQLVPSTTAEGVPFVLAQPKAKVSQQIVSIAQRLATPAESGERRRNTATTAAPATAS